MNIKHVQCFRDCVSPVTSVCRVPELSPAVNVHL